MEGVAACSAACTRFDFRRFWPTLSSATLETPADHAECQPLLGALEDRQDARVDEVAADVGLLSVAHPAEELGCVAGDVLRHPAGVELGEAGLHLSVGTALVELPGRPVGERAAAMQPQRHPAQP